MSSNRKKILVFSTYDFGGAGESAYRVTDGLIKIGYEAALIVKEKSRVEEFVYKAVQRGRETSIFKHLFKRISNRIFKKKKQYHLELDQNYCFYDIDEDENFMSTSSILDVLPFNPDIILMAWVTGFINTELTLKVQKETGAQVYWLMTDMAPITGGCHYAWDCKGFMNDCSDCPAILTVAQKDKAKQNLSIKRRNIDEGNFNIIAGSGWTLEQARRSTLFKNQSFYPIINGIVDFSIFNNSCRGIAKQVFNIPQEVKVIFCGAIFTGEKRKGIALFVEALTKLYRNSIVEDRNKIRILIAGNNLDENIFIQSIPFQILPIDFIKDNRLLSLAYQAADVFVCPSIEDSGPMMVNESLACGTPVVGFEMGMLHNMVLNGYNGFKVTLFDTSAMAVAIAKVLSLTESELHSFSLNAIGMVKKFASQESLQEVMTKLTSDAG